MKKYLLTMFLFVSVFAYVNADCCSSSGNFYLKGFGGANWLHFHKDQTKFDLGYAGALAVGYRFNPNWSLEIEGSYRYNKLKNQSYDDILSGKTVHVQGHTDSLAIMTNGYFDINLNSCLTPYIGLGLGYYSDRAKFSERYGRLAGHRFTSSCHGFAAQGILGVKTNLTEHVDLGLEYRYILARSNLHEQNVGLSLTYNF